MQFSVQKVDQSIIMMLEGKLMNEQQTSKIRDRISSGLSDNEKKFIFDLKSLEFVNSACLNFLVSSRNRIVDQGGDIVLCNVSDQLRKLLTMTRLESYFKIAGRTADAIAILNHAGKS
ncbi:MAG: STAS domain-containing protein [Chitinophagaceae bacterium]|nr:STAS domain-containing protein [Chitinophagaceae bacterium]